MDDNRRNDDVSSEITRLLLDWSQGNEAARDQLLILLQEELRCMAHGRLSNERRDITFETLDLVQEMVLRLLNRKTVEWQSSAHFRGEASNIMRLVLIDHARRRDAKRRNEGLKPSSLEVVPEIVIERDKNLIALDEGLNRLAEVASEQHEVLVRHYFGGQTCLELAKDMEIPEIRAKRHLRAGRVFLRQFVDVHRSVRSVTPVRDEP